MSARNSTDPVITAARYRANTESIAKQGRRDFGALDDTALVPATTIPGSDREVARREAEDRNAARDVARFTMKDTHGCTGLECTSDQHAADRMVMHQILAFLKLSRYATGPDVLGLRGPVERVREKDGIGRWKKVKPSQPGPSLLGGWLVAGVCGLGQRRSKGSERGWWGQAAVSASTARRRRLRRFGGCEEAIRLMCSGRYK